MEANTILTKRSQGMAKGEQFVFIADAAFRPWVPNFCLGPKPHLIVCRKSIANKFEGVKNVPQSEYLVMPASDFETQEGDQLNYEEIRLIRKEDQDSGNIVNWETPTELFKQSYIAGVDTAIPGSDITVLRLIPEEDEFEDESNKFEGE